MQQVTTYNTHTHAHVQTHVCIPHVYTHMYTVSSPHLVVVVVEEEEGVQRPGEGELEQHFLPCL